MFQGRNWGREGKGQVDLEDFENLPAYFFSLLRHIPPKLVAYA